MTREETLAIMSVLKAAYPTYYKGLNRNDAEAVVSLWTEMFKDEPAQVVAVAVKAHIASDSKGFPPHIGAIKDAIAKLHQPDQMTALEAWEHVRRAMRGASMSPSSCVYIGGKTDGKTTAEKNFERMPELVQRIVGSPSQLAQWADMDAEVINSVVSSNFQRSFNARAAHEREILTLPTDVRNAMQQISAGLRMPELTEGEKEYAKLQDTNF